FEDLQGCEGGSFGLGNDSLDTSQQLPILSAGRAAVHQLFMTSATTVTPSTSWQFRSPFRFGGDDLTECHRSQELDDLGPGSATRWNGDQGIRIKITDNWRVNLEYDVRYNSQPVADKKTTDTNIIVGFSYDIKP